jgi:TPR repeat protein
MMLSDGLKGALMDSSIKTRPANTTLNITVKPSLSEDETESLLSVAWMLEHGYGLEQDLASAFSIDLECAIAGDVDALNNVGWMLMNGYGVAQDLDEAIKFLEIAAAQGSTLAMVNLGNIYDGLYRNQSDNSYFDFAANPFYERYDIEPDTYTDFSKAAYWYERAADKGDIRGIFNYANLLHYGHGVPQDYFTALVLFSLIAAVDSRAIFYLGLYHLEGLGVKKNYELAFHYFATGAMAGDAYCYTQLGRMYGKGLGVARDAAMAFELYQAADELGDALAATNLGWHYETGTAVAADVQKAIRYYTKAATAAEPNALEALERLGVSP